MIPSPSIPLTLTRVSESPSSPPMGMVRVTSSILSLSSAWRRELSSSILIAVSLRRVTKPPHAALPRGRLNVEPSTFWVDLELPWKWGGYAPAPPGRRHLGIPPARILLEVLVRGSPTCLLLGRRSHRLIPKRGEILKVRR